jgi:2',3'-cyclic-nucleotide 2'-phosphodiesterase (5'-nucleotidase family)
MPKLDQLFDAIVEERERVIAVVVHLNDTYLIEERPTEGLPGFPRLVSTVHRIRSTVQELLGRDATLVVHSGDFLGPSRVSTRTAGATMLQLMNAVGVQWCVLGNHEFDYKEPALVARLGEARFGVTIANVSSTSVRVEPAVLWPSSDAPLVALTGIVSDEVATAFPKEHWAVRPARPALEEFVAAHTMVPFRIALTHANREEDRVLRRSLPGRTLLLGGHDHDISWVERDGIGAPVMKNLANLKTVRIIVLLGGGSLAEMDLRLRYGEMYTRRCAAAGVAPDLRPPIAKAEDPYAPSFPGDCEEVLQAVPAFDADLIRKIWTRVDPTSLHAAEPLLSAISRLPHRRDYESWILERDDHEPPDHDAAATVEEALRAGGREAEILRDVITDPREGFDTSEKAIRSVETPFGDLVAECVRRHGDADVAILNAGAFRADAVLPTQLRLGNVLDVFLYDNDRAIVVLDLPHMAVEALLVHARAKTGTGGYAQYYPRVLPGRETLCVAIARYLLENPFDGYQRALAASLSKPSEEIPTLVADKTKMTFGVVDAFRMHAANLTLPAVEAQGADDGPPEETFILIARDFWKVRQEVGDRTELYELFHFEAEDRSTKAVQTARDRLRAWVRALPEVDAAEAARQAKKSVAEVVGLAQRAHARLNELIGTLEDHKARYADGIPYDMLLDYAAFRMAGWNALGAADVETA